MKRYFIYARKSTDSEDRQMLSIEAQLIEVKQFIDNFSEKVQIVEQLTESRTAKEPGRPIFNKMITRIEKGEADGIISWHPDRLARNSIDGGKIIHMVDKGNIKFLEFPSYRFENTAQGKFMLNIIFGQSKYYVDNLSENVKRGIRQKLRRGEWSSLAPIGYTNNVKTRKIEIDTFYSEKIKRLFETYATGNYSLRDMTKYALSIELFSKLHNKPLGASVIQDILSKRIYCGIIKYKGDLYEGKHEPIISRELFNKVQEIMKDRARATRPKTNKRVFAFTGLIKCSQCDCMITAERHKGKYNYYHCTKKKGHCDSQFISEPELVNRINQTISSVIPPEKLTEYLKNKARDERLSLKNSVQDEIMQTDKMINEIDNKQARLLDVYLENGLTKREYFHKKESYMNQKYALQKQINYLEKGQFLWLELLEDFINSLAEPKKALETDNLFEKRNFLQKIGLNFSLGLGAPLQKNTVGLPENTADFETESGRPKENKATTTKNNSRKMKAKMFLSFDYKNLWKTFTENLSEKEFCRLWSG